MHEAGPAPADADLARFLDLDLSILAAEPAVYARYAEAIRAEYASIPDAIYRPGRAKVLQKFLDRPRLFHCGDLQARWDEAARQNLADEIARLTAAKR